MITKFIDVQNKMSCSMLSVLKEMMSDLRKGEQKILPYSKWGLTKLLYKRLKLYISKWTNFLRIKPIICLALFTFSAIWLLNLRCSSMKIPRSFISNLFSKIPLFIVYAYAWVMVSFSFEHICMVKHLLGWDNNKELKVQKNHWIYIFLQ